MSSSWLQRFLRRNEARAHREPDRELVAFFGRRRAFPSQRAFLEKLAERFPEGHALAERDLAYLIAELRGVDGVDAPTSLDLDDQLWFWSELWRRTGNAYAQGCYADTLLLAGDKGQAIHNFVDAFERDPALFAELGDEELGELARAEGPELWLRYNLAWLRAAMQEYADRDDDTVRERYSELLEEFAGNERALIDIRRLGDAMEALVQKGELPRALVRRGPTRGSIR